MADLCRRLRDAREAANLSIDEISSRTKISTAVLRAIEAGAFDRLPGDFYTRAFLKTYAREVHLSPEEVVAEYDDLRHPPQPVVESVVSHTEQAAPARAPRSFSIPWPRNPNAWGGFLLVVLFLLAGASLARQARHVPSAEPAAVAAASVAVPAPAGTSGRTPAAPEKLTIDIRPTAPIWVAATADGTSVIYRLLKPGEQVVVEGRKELSFRIGNAAAFTYAINGAPGKTLGGPDEVREFDITPANYLTFRR